MTGGIDGKFTVESGSSFTKALAKELGLNSEQRKKLGSVWNQIYSACGGLETLNNVKAGQEFDLSGQINTILGWVNTKLGTDLKAAPPVSAETSAPTSESSSTPDAAVTPDEDVTGAMEKLKKAEAGAKALTDAVTTAIDNETLEDFAKNLNKKYNEDAIGIMLDENDDNARTLVSAMSDFQRAKIIKMFNSGYSGEEPSIDDVINATKCHVLKLEANSKQEQENIKKQKEADHKAYVKTKSESLKINGNWDGIEQKFDDQYNKAKEGAKVLTGAVTTAIANDTLEDVAKNLNKKYNEDAISVMLGNNDDNARTLVSAMSDFQRVKIIKMFNSEYSGEEPSIDDVIIAAQEHVNALKRNQHEEARLVHNTTNTYNDSIEDIVTIFSADVSKLTKEEKTLDDGRKEIMVKLKDQDKEIRIKTAQPPVSNIESIVYNELTLTFNSDGSVVMQEGSNEPITYDSSLPLRFAGLIELRNIYTKLSKIPS